MNNHHPPEGVKNGGANNEPEGKKEMIQQQLVLLLHAHRCRQIEAEGRTKLSNCRVSHCETMKRVLAHMAQCRRGRECPEPHCASSKQIIMHWKACKSGYCPVCAPVQALTTAGSSAAANGNAGGCGGGGTPVAVGNPPHNNCYCCGDCVNAAAAANNLSRTGQQLDNTLNNMFAPQNNGQQNQNLKASKHKFPEETVTIAVVTTNTKEWHSEVSNESRLYLVGRLIGSMFPPMQPGDPRSNNACVYARRVEQEAFERADSREHYYRLLADNVFRVQQELKAKHSAQQNQQQQHLKMPEFGTAGAGKKPAMGATATAAAVGHRSPEIWLRLFQGQPPQQQQHHHSSFSSNCAGGAVVELEFDEVIFAAQLQQQPSTSRAAAGAFAGSIGTSEDNGAGGGGGGEEYSGRECSVCMNRAVNAVIYKCGHMCMCFECANDTKKRSGKCPICRAWIVDVIKCFQS